MDYKAYHDEYGVMEPVGTLGSFQERKQISCFRGEEYGGISSLAFDPQENLLWAATYGGHVTSFYSSSLDKYTSFQAHHEDIRQLQLTLGGVVSVTENEIRMTSRMGLPMFTMNDEHYLRKMNCALYLDDTSLLVGCHANRIITIDLTQAQIVGETRTSAGVCLLKLSESYVCCGDVLGQVGLLDPLSLQTVSSFPAHVAGMCDMDIVGNYLVTCGLSRLYGQICVDTQLKVFDLRFLRSVSPCDVTAFQPFLVRHAPTLETSLLVLSQTGEFQLLDLRGLVTPSNMVVHRINTASEEVMACSMDVGPSCQCFAFGDSRGVVHLWSDREDVMLNPYATQETVFPDQVEEPLPYLSWDSDDPTSSPLSAVGASLNSHSGTALFSNWPVHCSKFTRRITPAIDPEVLEKMRMSHFVGHAPKPAHIRYNQVLYDLDRDMGDHVPESPMMREKNPLSLIPKPYRQVEIKYSKLGIETFDFSHYNGTKFAGLEIHIPNAYCNSMLQVLYFLEPIRCSVQKHLCSKEFCLACELGLLFRMLDHSEGEICQANNFLRVFRTLREASALGLLLNWERENHRKDLGQLIQSWTRFVLQQLNQEMDPQQTQAPPVTTPTSYTGTPSTPTFNILTPTSTNTPSVELGAGLFLDGSAGGGKEDGLEGKGGEVSVVQRIFGSAVKTEVKCHCGWSTVMQRPELLFSLHYPHNSAAHSGSGVGNKRSLVEQKMLFASVLQLSICRRQSMHSWCERCAKYTPTTHEKSLCSLPQVMALNCQVDSEQDRDFWQAQQRRDKAAQQDGHSHIPQRWVPLYLRMSIHGGSILNVSQGLDNASRDLRMSIHGDSILDVSQGLDNASRDGYMDSAKSADVFGVSSRLPQRSSKCLEISAPVFGRSSSSVSLSGEDSHSDAVGCVGSDAGDGGLVSDNVLSVNLDVNSGGGGSGCEREMEKDDWRVSSRIVRVSSAEEDAAMMEREKVEQNDGDEKVDINIEEVVVTVIGGADNVPRGAGSDGIVVGGFDGGKEGGDGVCCGVGGGVGGDGRGGEVDDGVGGCDGRGGGVDDGVGKGDGGGGGVDGGVGDAGGGVSDGGGVDVGSGGEGGEVGEDVGGSGGCGNGDGFMRDEEESGEYELSMIVCHVKESWMEHHGNLVAHIKVGPSYHLRKEGKAKSQWYLFNDFHITSMKESEVGVFQMEWLTPAVLIYTRKDYIQAYNTHVSCQLDPIVLLSETHSSRLVLSPSMSTPLAFSELPSAGDLVGVDAEFVALNQEEAEVRSDGTHTTLKPGQFSVARITVIRGEGPMKGSPFIDDYISTSEQVVDYLTKFSGIRPGDLDATMSSKHLTTLKASYLKLLYLLESGVTFVGHGLNKDFRVINILVPQKQIIDTVKLFHLPKQRYISLKFLAWFFLDLRIQKVTHDSCEDARTALFLYHKYQELESRSQVAQMLGKLYETGRHYNWQVPDS